jgi:hypothetical protein
MKVRYGEEVANHSGPESCVCAREGAGEVLTGEIDREPGDAHHVYRRPVYRWYPIRRLSHINRGRGGLAANSTAGFEISPDQENVVTDEINSKFALPERQFSSVPHLRCSMVVLKDSIFPQRVTVGTISPALLPPLDALHGQLCKFSTTQNQPQDPGPSE